MSKTRTVFNQRKCSSQSGERAVALVVNELCTEFIKKTDKQGGSAEFVSTTN